MVLPRLTAPLLSIFVEDEGAALAAAFAEGWAGVAAVGLAAVGLAAPAVAVLEGSGTPGCCTAHGSAARATLPALVNKNAVREVRIGADIFALMFLALRVVVSLGYAWFVSFCRLFKDLVRVYRSAWPPHSRRGKERKGKMQMRTIGRRIAGGTNIANHLALLNRIAFF